MIKNKYILLFVLISGVIASCKKDQYMVYEDVARLQFGQEPRLLYRPEYDFNDTLKMLSFYFSNSSVTEDTVFFDLYAIGGTRNTDRSFTLSQEQIPNEVNAEPGKHYVAFNDPRAQKNFVIKAGTVHTSVPIILLRDASLKTTTPKLKFVVTADDNFQLGERNKVWRRIEFTDRLSQPSAWDASMTQYYIGKYSVAKHQFMIQTTGDRWDQEFIASIKSDLSLVNYYKAILRTALIDYNKANPTKPLTDEFGEAVVFPA